MKGKSKANFIIISFKKNILTIIFVLFMICLLIFSKQSIEACKNALYLWINSVVPCLLPFFIATELLNYTNIPFLVGKLLNPIMKPIFNVPGVGAYAFIMGIISGYPIGAKIVTDLRKKQLCTKEEGERLLAFTNNSGPLFIIGTVGISLLGNTSIGILLFLTHILACISVGIVFCFWKRNNLLEKKTIKYIDNNFVKSKNPNFNSLGEILTNSISNSVYNIVIIGGFILFFGLIISILNNSGMMNLLSNCISPILAFLNIPLGFSDGIICGILELTNGLKLVCSVPNKAISINIIICSFLLGFSGLSICLQILNITSKSDLSIIPYILGKIMQSIFAVLYTFIFIHFFPIFNLDIVPIFSESNSTNLIQSYYYGYQGLILIFISLFIIFAIYWKKKNHKHTKVRII